MRPVVMKGPGMAQFLRSPWPSSHRGGVSFPGSQHLTASMTAPATPGCPGAVRLC